MLTSSHVSDAHLSYCRVNYISTPQQVKLFEKGLLENANSVTFICSNSDDFLFWAHNVSVNMAILDTNGNKWYNQHGYSMYDSVIEWTLETHKEQIKWEEYTKYYIFAYEKHMCLAMWYDV